MRICTACSKENPEYLKYCLDCGKNIDPSSKNSRVKIYATGLVLIGAAIAFVAIKKPALWAVAGNRLIEQVPVEPSAERVSPMKLSSTKAETKQVVPVLVEEPKALAPTVVQARELKPTESMVAVEPTVTSSAVSEKSGPKPRKRVQHQALDTADILAGTSPASLKIKSAHDGSPTGAASASEGYMRMLHNVIVKEYLGSLAQHGLTNERGEWSRITILVHSRTNEIEILHLPDNLDFQKKELLRKVINGCSGRVLCPKELNDDMGELVKLEFPLATNS